MEPLFFTRGLAVRSTVRRRTGPAWGTHAALLASRLLAGAICAGTVGAQTCYHLGSMPLPATVTSAPLALDCPGAPDWPMWHLFTPAHRAPVVHAGFNPGNATPRSRILVAYRCTGLWFAPIIVSRIAYMGYVTDQPQHACNPTP